MHTLETALEFLCKPVLGLFIGFYLYFIVLDSGFFSSVRPQPNLMNFWE